MPCCYVHHGVKTLQYLTTALLLLATEAAAHDIASEVIAPVAFNKAKDLLPVPEASFQELRATNAALRVSNASLKQANSNQIATLEAIEDKIKRLSPGSSGKNGIDAQDGPRGPTGDMGQSSVTGGTGFSGGSNISGSNGLSGNAGGTGQAGLTRDGPSGYNGATGQDGKDAQSGTSGALGTLHLGNTGSKGPSGLTGLSATTGATGANVQGRQGVQGSGNTGMIGGNGALGISGASVTVTGALGLSGASGNSGLTGVGCTTPYVTLNFDDINAPPYLGLQKPFTYRGLTIANPINENFLIVNQQFYGGSYAAHSLPNFFLANGFNTIVTLRDSSGAVFGLQSIYLAGSPFSNCPELLTVSGSTNGGVPNPACTVQPFAIGGGSSPVQVTFDPPCFATTITVQALNNCPDNNILTLDDITICPTTTTSSIA